MQEKELKKQKFSRFFSPFALLVFVESTGVITSRLCSLCFKFFSPKVSLSSPLTSLRIVELLALLPFSDFGLCLSFGNPSATLTGFSAHHHDKC